MIMRYSRFHMLNKSSLIDHGIYIRSPHFLVQNIFDHQNTQ